MINGKGKTYNKSEKIFKKQNESGYECIHPTPKLDQLLSS